jgi:hypothetical protein
MGDDEENPNAFIDTRLVSRYPHKVLHPSDVPNSRQSGS